MGEAAEAVRSSIESEVELTEMQLTATAPLEEQQLYSSPPMRSLQLDPQPLPADAVMHAETSTDEPVAAAHEQDEMYNHHALLELQEILQQTSRSPSAPLSPSATRTAALQQPHPSHDEPFIVTPAVVASASNRYSAAHQKRVDAYYVRLQAYHLQRTLATEEKQQLDDRRDRILEQHTLTRLKQAMRLQHREQRQGLETQADTSATLLTPFALTDPVEATLARQAEVAALREARLACKHRIQQMHADVAAQRRDNEAMEEERLRRARLAADDAECDRQMQTKQLRAERQRRARQLALEREASAHFVTIANSVAQQVGQLERREWRENRAADTRQAVQHRKQRTEQHRELVQAVKTENYHRRQINALLQQQTAQALLAQRQSATQLRQQRHRGALLSAALAEHDNTQPASLQLPPTAVQPPASPIPALSLSSQTGTASSLSESFSPTPLLPFTYASSESSTDASPLFIPQPADSNAPALSPLAPLLFLLESKAKREAERKSALEE